MEDVQVYYPENLSWCKVILPQILLTNRSFKIMALKNLTSNFAGERKSKQL